MLSKSCKYGLRAVVFIAEYSSNGTNVRLQKISSDLELPMPYLAKILQSLVKKKLLHSTKGPNGGFTLAQNSKNIYLNDVVEAIDGDDVFLKCVLHTENCGCLDDNNSVCLLHSSYVEQREKIKKIFDTKTIYSLMKVAK